METSFLEKVSNTIFNTINWCEDFGNKLIERNTLWSRILYVLGGITLALYVVCVGILFMLLTIVYILGLWTGQIIIAPLYWILTGKKIEVFEKEIENLL